MTSDQGLRDTDEKDEARLRALYQRALAERDAAAAYRESARENCVALEAMLALVRREDSEEERLAVLDHVMSCDACRRELDLLRAIEAAGTKAAGARPSARVSRVALPFTWRRVVPLAVAASLLVAVGLGLRERAESDVSRSGGTSGGSALSPITPEAEASVAPGSPLTFAWRPDPDARRYVLEVLDTGGGVVLTQSTTDTTVTLRDVSRLTRGGEYRWWVRAVENGGTLRTSPVSRLRVRTE